MRLDDLIQYLPLGREKDLADFGCGYGLLLQRVAHKVRSYIGIDTSIEFIEKARMSLQKYLGIKASFVCSNVEDFTDNNSESVDVGVAFDVSEHIEDD